MRPRWCSAGARAPLGGLALAGALALGGCAPAHTGAPAPPSARMPIQLSEPDVHAVAALLRLEDRRELHPAAIATYAGRATPEVRRRAYLAAGRIGGPGAPALVRPGLRDPEARARAAAAFALGLLRDTASVDSLARVAFAGGGRDAENAVFALGRMNTTAAHAALVAVLRLAHPYPTQRQGRVQRRVDGPGPAFVAAPVPSLQGEALLALWRFRRTPQDGPLAAGFASSPDTALRWRAAYALMRLGDPATVPTLLQLLRDPYPEVRALAARGLRASVADSAGRRSEARTALLAALQDSAPHVRINAVGTLAGYRAAELVPSIQALLRDPDANVASAAAQALGVLRQTGGAEPLRQLVEDTSARLPLRAAALAALVRLDTAGGVAEVERWTGSASWRQRYYAASAAGGASLRLAAPSLVKLARDPDPRVVGQALSTLPELTGDSLAPPRALLVESLGARDPIIRAAAINALAARPDPADLELYLDSYARAAADSLDDAALAALDALAALQKRAAPAARTFFARFTRSRDYVVRRAVAEKLGNQWGPVTPVETGRDTAFYLDLVRRWVVPALAGAPAPRLRLTTATGPAAEPGELVIELNAAEAPLTVDNFLVLARRHFFDGAHWHRVVPNFVVQDGDPRGDGNGGPGWAIRDELNELRYLRGTLGMALSGPDTGGSQFFLTLSPQPHLDAGYTVFGRLLDGFDVLDRVVQDDPIGAIDLLP